MIFKSVSTNSAHMSHVLLAKVQILKINCECNECEKRLREFCTVL